MLQEIFEIIYKAASDSFLQVGVFVGAVLLFFAYVNYKRKGQLVNYLEKSTKYQPFLGALLGLTPGCGGAIFVMPLYVKGSVSFGTVIATLVATMGDSAFVLLTTLPYQYLLVSIISFAVAIVTGYMVDYFKIDSLHKSDREALKRENLLTEKEHATIESRLISLGEHTKNMSHLSHEEGDHIDYLFHHKNRKITDVFTFNFSHKYAYKFFWAVVAVGFILGLLLLFQVDVDNLSIPNLGLIFGILGTLLSILYVIVNKKFTINDSYEEEESKIFSLKETFIHSAEDTAFVSFWVFLAYVVYELAVYFIGGPAIIETWLSTTGVFSILVGALIGLIPGCGPQIIFVSLFAQGGIPFAALLANVISQDGDALFPLLAIDGKSSLKATLITTVPALLVGLIFYYFIELNFF